MSEPAPLPAWLAATSADGVLRVRWDVQSDAIAAAYLLVSLRSVNADDTAAFWAGELDGDIIRHPVEAHAGFAAVPVPTGRPLYLALIARAPDGSLAASSRVQLAPEHFGPPRVLEAPVDHDHSPGAPAALVFVAGTDAPDLQALARRIALAAGTPQAAGVPRSPAFAARPRWSLVRLAFDPPAGAPLLLVRRARAIEATELAQFVHAPPADAIALPPDTDGLVDALPGSEPDADGVTFYALFSGPAPWAPVPLVPLLPPFDAAKRPALLGPVEDRLAPAIDQRLDRLSTAALPLGELPLELALVDAAVQCLPPTSPLRRRVEARIAQQRRAPRY